jgi:folate-dependent tRNA-U54 methylase TrmFO/GidA
METRKRNAMVNKKLHENRKENVTNANHTNTGGDLMCSDTNRVFSATNTVIGDGRS